MADGLFSDIAKEVGAAVGSIVPDVAEALGSIGDQATHALEGLSSISDHVVEALGQPLPQDVELPVAEPHHDAAPDAQPDTSAQPWFTTPHDAGQAPELTHAQELMDATRQQMDEATHLLQQQADVETAIAHNLGGGGASGSFGGGTGSSATEDVGVAVAHDTTHATVEAMPGVAYTDAHTDAHTDTHADVHADVHEAAQIDHHDATAPVIEAHSASDVDATVAEPAIGGVNAKTVAAVRDSAAPVVEQAQAVAVQSADVSATTDSHSAHDSATSAHDDHGHHDSHDAHDDEAATDEHVEPVHEEPAAEWHAADPTPAHTD